MSDQKLDPQTEPRPESSAKTEPGTGRRWLILARRLLIGLLVLVVVLVGVVAFLVGTTAGGRIVLSIADGFLPDDIVVDVAEFDGRLISRFELHGVALQIPELEAEADRLQVTWRGRGILDKQVHVETLIVEGLDLHLVDSEPDSLPEEPKPEPDSEPKPPLADLPVTISFDSITVLNGSFSAEATVSVTGIQATVTGPQPAEPGRPDALRLSASAHAVLPDIASGDAVLYGIGSTAAIAIDSLFVETLGGQATVAGDVTWWPEVTWDLDLEADGLEPAGLAVLPDPEEWPGQLSLSASSTGTVLDGTVELQAAIDTVHGMIRDEPLGGRLELHIVDTEIELPAARIDWGPARVNASGTASDVLDLEFDATVPDIGLVLPGATGTLTASGRASGPRDTPRFQATVRADSVVMDAGSASSVAGDVDLDLAGPLQADLVAQGLVVADQELDSAHVVLTGRREAHTLELTASGPGLDLDVAAAGGLDAANSWSGSLDTLHVSADTVGTWELTAPTNLSVATSGEFALNLEQVCLVSDPAARICAEGEFGGATTRLAATIDSLRVERFAALMPEGYRAEAGVDAVIDLEQRQDGAVTGTIDLRTTAGSLTVPVSLRPDDTDESTVLRFEPIVLDVSSTDEGSRGQVDVVVTDSLQAPLLRLSGELDSPFALYEAAELADLENQPFSTRFELDIDDMEAFSTAVLPRWDAWGRFHAAVELDVDTDGRLTGSLSAATDSLHLRNTVRRQAWQLSVEPARLDARVGPDGLTGDLELIVTVPEEGPLLEASGQIRMPGVTSLDLVPEEQPVDASLSVRVGNMYFVEAFLPEVTEARGTFELDSQIGGTLAELTVDGNATLADGYALIPLMGLELQDIQFAAAGRPNGEVELDGQVRSGDGILTMSGRSERYPSAEEPTTISIRGERLQIIDAPEVSLVAEPELDLVFDGSTLSLTGDVRIPRGRIGIPDVPESAVTPSSDVVIVGDTLVERDSPVPIEADITVALGDDVFFNGLGFNAKVVGEVNVTQTAAGEPRGTGEIRFVNGTFRQLGQELRIDPGRLLFNGPIDNPSVDARAFVRAQDGTEAGFRVGGTVQNLDVTTYSNPPKSDSDIMAYILFGRPMSQTTGDQGSQATNAATVLGANMLAMSLAPSVGLDEARVETGTQQNKAQFVVGKYLTPRLYVGYGIGIYEPISTLRLRYLLTARWTVEAITGDQQSADVLWRIERGGPKDEPVEEATATEDAPAAGDSAPTEGEPADPASPRAAANTDSGS